MLSAITNDKMWYVIHAPEQITPAKVHEGNTCVWLEEQSVKSNSFPRQLTLVYADILFVIT